ncbi:MAG TPA: vitamin B12 dependent-methionine synthase activation domain-containing protein, partial [Nocardioidaceae bacterium]|nr:vitamin B12 dependent-methionine synthase activation domain-containing protein [Nocardioidaceae bacterium]
MSGLLVRSTVVMRENLEEMNRRGVASRWPVILGGAALTRAYVETDLAAVFDGEVRYARDAFEGLHLMDAVAAAKHDPARSLAETLPPRRARRVRVDAGPRTERPAALARSDVTTEHAVPVPPFWGSRVVKGLSLASYADWLDERATLQGRWGLRGTPGSGPSSEELAEREGRPRLRAWLARLHTDGLLDAGVAYGYFPCVSEGEDLVVLDERGGERTRFTFPRQSRGRRLCLADFFRPRSSGDVDVVALQVVTVGARLSAATAELFARNAYRDYLELHGLSVQLAEALAEMWHARVREELGLETAGPTDRQAALRHQDYRGARYSFGYPACPDLADRRKLVELLEPARIGVTLSEELQLHPEQSTDALIVHHPQARYFGTA